MLLKVVWSSKNKHIRTSFGKKLTAANFASLRSLEVLNLGGNNFNGSLPNVMDFSLFPLLLLLHSLSPLNSMVELALGACLYNGHVQITLLNNFVFDEFFFFF